jgi:predicted TIM-barrel fold metal-dependent hydrolase
MTIVDAHGHAWPNLADERFGTRAERMTSLQRVFLWHNQPVRRLSDGAVVPGDPFHLYDGKGSGISNLHDVGMRPGEFGRILWTHDGVDYYRTWMPVSLQVMEAPAGLMLAQMDNAGVDKAVLSRGLGYGRINEWLADVCRAHPTRLFASAQISEWEAHTDEQLEELRRCVEEYDCRALYFEDYGFMWIDYALDYDSAELAPFWDEVARLGVPVQWEVRIREKFGPEEWDRHLRRLLEFVDRRSDVTHVMTHVFDMRLYQNQQLSPTILEILSRPHVYCELTFFLSNSALGWEYPYPEARDRIARLYQEVGPDRLMWGADPPACERVCTYRQALDHVRVHMADQLPPDDLAKILGGNAVRLFDLDRPVRPA